jgi:hypothetical protein
MIDSEDYRVIARLEELNSGEQLELGFIEREERIKAAKRVISSYGAFLRRANRALRKAEGLQRSLTIELESWHLWIATRSSGSRHQKT